MASCSSLLAVLALSLLLGCLLHDSHGRPGPSWQAAASAMPPPDVNLTQLREESLAMFRFGYGEYMRLAFPRDDLRPISCRGKDSQGGIALTLIDSLDTLIVMGERQRLREAVQWLSANASFDVDARVHVFELTIRAVGGLLSAHMLLEQDPQLVPGYSGSLLRLAVDLTDRFMPAFDTPTGVPLSWINLRHGQILGDVRSTCTACAGTLLLEFGVLSRLTGNATYERRARHAVERIFGMRSPRGLVGNTLDCDSGAWIRTDAGVGAGVDSFYEYLLKAYLAFGDASYLDMFKEVYAAAMTNLQLDPSWNGHVWLVDVDMHAGQVLHPFVWSLGAFWPGLQALAGQVEEGHALHANWTSAWDRFGWLPEMFDVGMENRHPSESGYPLRPELMESTFLLHAASGDPRLLGVGAALHARLRDKNRVKCGYASVGDVSTGQLEDTMESFFLSETVKYLYLLFSNASALVDHFVLSTEGHLLPPSPDLLEGRVSDRPSLDAGQAQAANRSESQAFQPPAPLCGNASCSQPPGSGKGKGTAAQCSQGEDQQQHSGSSTQAEPGTCSWGDPAQDQGGQQQEAAGGSAPSGEPRRSSKHQLASYVDDKCRSLCRADQHTADALHQATEALRASLPLLPLPPAGPGLLRRRRCTACREVSAAVRHAELAKLRASRQAAENKVASAMAKLGRLTSAPAVAPSGLAVNRQFMCVLEESGKGSLGCGVFKELPPRQMSKKRLHTLPQNYLLIQLTDPPADMAAAVAAADATQQQQQQQQQGCMAPGLDPAHLVTVDTVLPGGSRAAFRGLLAEFGPVFEPACKDFWKGAAGGGSSGGGGTPGPPAGSPVVWRGQQLEIREKEVAGRRHRLVHIPADESDEEDGDEDDPYEDPDLQEQQGGGSSGCSSGSSGPGGGASSSSAAADADGSQSPPCGSSDSGGAASLPPSVLCSLEATAVAAEPLDACAPLQNAEEVAGSVAVVQRGSCMFVDKVLTAQRAGAVGVIVVHSEDELMSMGTDQHGSQADIPAVLLPRTNGSVLLTALHGQQGGSGGARVPVRLYAAPEAAAAAAAAAAASSTSGVEQCLAGGAGLAAQQAHAQQVELVMSPHAQLWLFNKVAANSQDPAGAFARILGQIQAQFQPLAAALAKEQATALGKAAGNGGGDRGTDDEADV